MLAYLPHKEADTIIIRPDESLTWRIEVGLTTRESKSGGCTIFEEAKVPDEMLELAINSAIRHVSKCIEVRFKKIGISGSGVEKVAKALKDIHGKSKQSVSLFSVSLSHDFTAPKMLGRALQNRFADIRKDDLVESLEEGIVILGELINSFLLEKVGNSYVRMRDETKIVLQELFIASLLLRHGGLGLTETPKVEQWTNVKEIELMNNKLSELPENPKCPFLQKLFLHNLSYEF
ncbi:putative disease resistance protein [Camellia lanceoleosa]|uniref:Disease resistance protein n=1 Tax=Camellia lanceoleosa TaxID=1840588 RepID=A0ACC0IP47_9ERIC|nr:putative disease resistance protein [Camellia lanceoleosa]